MTINDLGKLARRYDPVARTDLILATKHHAPRSPGTVETTSYGLDPVFINQINSASLHDYQQQFQQVYSSTSTATGTGGLWPDNFATWITGNTK